MDLRNLQLHIFNVRFLKQQPKDAWGLDPLLRARVALVPVNSGDTVDNK